MQHTPLCHAWRLFRSPWLPSTVYCASPLSAVMNTSATSRPLARPAAKPASLDTVQYETLVPSA